MNQFKNAQVIILPTKNTNSLFKIDNKLCYGLNTTGLGKHFQHLYIVNDDEIKESDWCIIDNNVGISTGYQLLQCINTDAENGWFWFNDFKTGRCKKVIATTDTSLKIKHKHSPYLRDWDLLQLSQEWIEYYISEYNKGNVITDVKVEYSTTWVANHNNGYHKQELKTNPDNTITIKSTKDSWNREELIHLVKKASRIGIYDDEFMDDWIKENL